MESLNEFMLLFRMNPSNEQPTADQIATMQQQWQKFIGAIASQAKLVNVSRLGFQGAIVKNDKSIENNMYVENNLFVSGNLTMKAKNLEEAIATAKNCPILLSGGTVEARETIPMS